MPDPNAQQEILSEIVTKYLLGEEISIIRSSLRAVCSENKQNASALYGKIIASPEITKKLYPLLQVPEEKQRSYGNNQTLLTLLTRINKDGQDYAHLAYLLGLIDQT